jgi:chemotaxis protein MotB
MAKCPNKIPGWMVTFADLMALMLTFFVLLFSMSKIDEKKYQSISHALVFGFRPHWITRPTAKPNENNLEMGPIRQNLFKALPKPDTKYNAEEDKTAKIAGARQAMYKHFQMELQQEITKGLVKIEIADEQIIMRFPEHVTFESGSDMLSAQAISVIHHIAKILTGFKGKILVSGHSDDRKISTERFPSNWELSAARAIAVVTELLASGQLDTRRIVASGHADTLPLVPNDSEQNRAKNRRVEIRLTGF